MPPKKSIVRSVCLFVIILMIGCSPYIYKEEVLIFKNGVEQASQMLDSQKEFLSKRGMIINRDDLLEKKSPRLVVSDGCVEAILCMESVAYSKGFRRLCKDFQSEIDGSSENTISIDVYKNAYNAAVSKCGVNAEGGLKVEISVQLPTYKKVLSVLSNYSAALAGIIDAEDKKALSDSASKACASMQQLYSTASTVKFADENSSKEEEAKKNERLEKEGKAITAVCGLITEIGNIILDCQRLKILTTVVNKGDSKIELLANYLASESRKVNSIVLRNELDQLNDAVEATVELQGKEKEYLASIDLAVSQKNKFMSVLKNNPEAVYLSMIEAHRKLKQAVNDPKTQLKTAIESIEKFHKIAKDAHEAIKAISNKDTAK